MYRQGRWQEPLLNELGRKGRFGYAPRIDEGVIQEVGSIEDLVPKKLKRSTLLIPGVSQPQVVRHFTRLSQMNFAVDLGTYPLGSCTMKHNPKLGERIASDARLKRLHPYQPEPTVQGMLRLLYDLTQVLGEITGLRSVSLAPAAGAEGEFVGTLITRAWIKDRGEIDVRNEMLVPDSAHGTNPATAALAGFKVVKVPSDEEGLVDVEAVKELSTERTAGLMLTNPNTLGLFEKNIREIAGVVHDAGGLMYYDGANMNALLARARPSDMGFDIAHLNLHKTFSTPHGGGGPGAGPVCVTEELGQYLPVPIIESQNGMFSLKHDLPKTIGRVKAFVGNIGILVRAYVYIRLMGGDGLKAVSTQAVLASNYLLNKLDPSHFTLAFDRESRRMHEFVVSVKGLREKIPMPAVELAKALLDEGVHSPTVYFPLTVEEAVMIEPTETESVEELDQYAEYLNKLASEILTRPEDVKQKPKNTAIGRLDEARASRVSTMRLNWKDL